MQPPSPPRHHSACTCTLRPMHGDPGPHDMIWDLHDLGSSCGSQISCKWLKLEAGVRECGRLIHVMDRMSDQPGWLELM